MICLKQSFWDTSYLGDSAPECPHPVTMGSGVIFDFFGISSQNRCLWAAWRDRGQAGSREADDKAHDASERQSRLRTGPKWFEN